MRKNRTRNSSRWIPLLLCMLVYCLAAGAKTGKKVNASFVDEPLASALKTVSRQSEVHIGFAYEDVNGYKVTLTLKDATAKEAVDKLIGKFPLTCSVTNNGIMVTKTTAKAQAATSNDDNVLEGTVVDVDGNPLPRVIVNEKGNTKKNVLTDNDGVFRYPLAKGAKATLEFSFIGMETQTVNVTNNGQRKRLNIVMQDNSTELKDVVVTGIFKRNKEGFTGSANHMSGDDIRQLSSGNILNAIEMLDPGFRKGSTMMSGSNPSSLPDFSMRGQSSMGDYSTDETIIMRGDVDTRPNQPLFVLDGIIGVSVTKIMDIDPQLIESVTLLKDAAAMAIYGSQASNGVVVVETKAPEAGKLRFTYNGNFKVEWPDLTDYDLLNAAEKLELEKRAGYYDDAGSVQNSVNRLNSYRRKLLEVQRGVDTYWLSQPLQTVFNHRHGFNVEGGSRELRYKLYAGINEAPGVMKGTGVYGRNVSLDVRYRSGKLLISNVAYVDYTKSDRTSPYGSFQLYTQLNPYYRIYDETGQIGQYLERAVTTTDNYYQTSGADIGNPMYNTLYNTLDRNVAFEVRDAFRVEYNPIKNLRLAMDLTITKSTSDTDIFKSANHTDYITVTNVEQRGSYKWSNTSNLGYDLAFTANYNKVWNNKHVLATYFRYNIQENKLHTAGAYATGFPNDNMDEIYLGAKVQSTSGDESTTRAIGAVTTLSYTYDQRYAVDLNGRIDASSQFGKNNRVAPFWSTGLRWNADKEKFVKKLGIFDELILRATYGETGSQGFSPYQALQMYNYANSMRIYQSSDVVGTLLYAMGNEDLKWQITDSYNLGLDFTMFKNVISGRFEYYYKYTKNTVLDYSLPPSMGFSSVKDNLGNILNQGYEFNLRIMPLRIPAKQMTLSFVANGSHNVNKIKKISNALKRRNDAELAEDSSNPNKLSRPLPRYVEGYSQSMIWAVQSLGIDPITGREIYLSRDGKRTSEWNAVDLVPCGDTEPDLAGTLSTNFTWRGLTFTVAARYQFGGQYYNKTLLDKVENANLRYNVDRRAYTDRWANPGDLVAFKAVTTNVNGQQTKASSRFVMDNNELVLNVINLEYRFESRYEKFIKRMGLTSASVGLYMEDLFHLSTIKQERGITYPMSRQVSMSLSLSF